MCLYQTHLLYLVGDSNGKTDCTRIYNHKVGLSTFMPTYGLVVVGHRSRNRSQSNVILSSTSEIRALENHKLYLRTKHFKAKSSSESRASWPRSPQPNAHHLLPMARVSVDKSSQTYEPPRLPEYLRNVFDLKPVVGVPSDEEVIGIHAVIRAAYNVSHGGSFREHDTAYITFLMV